jgi:hypothetical protein
MDGVSPSARSRQPEGTKQPYKEDSDTSAHSGAF